MSNEQVSTTFGTSTTTVPNTPAPDPVLELVGEGKKFKTVQDLAKGKIEADNFVEQLKTENKALREALGNGEDTTAIQVKLDKLLAAKDERTTTPPTGNQTTKESLTQEDVLNLLNQDRVKNQMLGNSRTFNETVTKVLGDKAEETVKKRVADLGLDLGLFNQMVATAPESALRLVGINKTTTNSVTSGTKDTTVNTEAYFASAGDNGKKNFAHYEKLRKEMGAGFYTPAMQKEVMESRKTMGDEFYK